VSGFADWLICLSGNLDYNLGMFPSPVARTLPGKAMAQYLANLSYALPPGILLGLIEGVNKNTPRSVADSLIARSVVRLRQLQAAAPHPQLTAGPGRLLEAISTLRQPRTLEESILTWVLFELCVGLILQLLTSGNPRSPNPGDSKSHDRFLSPETAGPGLPAAAGGTHLKRPLPA